MKVDAGIKHQICLGGGGPFLAASTWPCALNHRFGLSFHTWKIRVRLAPLPSRPKSNGILMRGTGFITNWKLHHVPSRKSGELWGSMWQFVISKGMFWQKWEQEILSGQPGGMVSSWELFFKNCLWPAHLTWSWTQTVQLQKSAPEEELNLWWHPKDKYQRMGS